MREEAAHTAAVSLALSTLTEETLDAVAAVLRQLPPSAVVPQLVACGTALAPDVHAALAAELSPCDGFLPLLRATLTEALPCATRGCTSLLEQLATAREPGLRGVAADVLDDVLSRQPAGLDDEELGVLLVRVGPRLLASSPDEADAESTALWLSSLSAGLVCCGQRCGQGGAMCSVCAAHAAEAASWRSSVAPALACIENDEGVPSGLGRLTNALLFGGSPSDVGDAAVQNSGRMAASRPLTVRGVALTFAQRGSFDSGPAGGGGGATGMVLWGAAALLAWHLEHDTGTRASLEKGASVLELGAGLGSVSAAAAILGGRVLATDGDADVVAQAELNCEAAVAAARLAGFHAARVATARLRWGNQDDWAAVVASHGAAYDMVLAADCAFFVEAHGPLAELIHALALPGAAVLLAHTWRRLTPERAFFARLTDLGLAVQDVTPAADSGAPQPGSTVLLRITART